jgi:hypothetical protein
LKPLTAWVVWGFSARQADGLNLGSIIETLNKNGAEA